MKTAMLLAALIGTLPMAARAVCVDTMRIDHTDAPDDTALLMYMTDKSVYRAKVQGGCVGLANDTGGFTWEPDSGTHEVCGNLFTIRLNTSHAVCLMGDIEQIKPPRHG